MENHSNSLVMKTPEQHKKTKTYNTGQGAPKSEAVQYITGGRAKVNY